MGLQALQAAVAAFKYLSIAVMLFVRCSLFYALALVFIIRIGCTPKSHSVFKSPLLMLATQLGF